MIGITIGIGEEWKRLAEKTAARMELMTGVKCHVIDRDDFGCAHPSWLKCHVHKIFPNEDSYFLFDADILPLRGWNPQSLFREMKRAFIGVPEPNFNDEILAECKQWELGFPDIYVNGGLLIFGAEHAWIWEKVWTFHPNGGTWLEQTALNRVLADEAVEMCRLPRHFNLIAHFGKIKSIYARSTLKDAMNVHTCALKTPEAITAVHNEILAYFHSGKAGKTRLELLTDLHHRFGFGTSHGAELGVFEGEFSKAIDSILAPETLHLVDLFQGRVISGDVNGQNIHWADMAAVKEKLAQELPSAHLHAMDSVTWLDSQPEASLDWVYIDTSHEYEHTLKELHAASFAVRPGGVIAGHDFSQAFEGVIRAVREFCGETGKTFKVYDGNLLPSFWIEN